MSEVKSCADCRWFSLNGEGIWVCSQPHWRKRRTWVVRAAGYSSCKASGGLAVYFEPDDTKRAQWERWCQQQPWARRRGVRT